MKLSANDPGASHSRVVVTLDGAPVSYCTFADEEVGCVVVLVRDEDGTLTIVDDGSPGSPRPAEVTLFGVVHIILP